MFAAKVRKEKEKTKSNTADKLKTKKVIIANEETKLSHQTVN